MTYRLYLPLLALLSLAPVACSDDGGGGGSGGTGGTGATAGSGGAGSNGGAAGNGGSAQGGSAGDGGSAQGGSGGDGGSAQGGSAGETSGGSGGGGGGGSEGVGEQGSCDLPTPIGSCSMSLFCVEYYAELGLDLKAGCEEGGGTYSASGCVGTLGWCEAQSGPYTSSIQFSDNLDAVKAQCEDKGGVWCEVPTN